MKNFLLQKHLKNYPDDAEILIRKPNGVMTEVDYITPKFDGLLLSNCDVEEFEFKNKELLQCQEIEKSK